MLLGSRSAEKGNAALKQLQSQDAENAGPVQLVVIDVTDDNSIECAAAAVQQKHGKLDMLVNNAAIGYPTGSVRQQLQTSFDTNAIGPAVVAIAFAPLLQRSTGSPRIVNVSSGAGSLNRRLDASSPHYKMQEVQYRASKAALNMVTACQFVEYEDLGLKVFTFNPGFVESNLGPQNKAENGAKLATEAALPLIDILEGKRDAEVGKFLNFNGVYPW